MMIDDSNLDQDGHLRHADSWTPQIAQVLADTLGIVLTEEHYTILAMVRDYYQRFGHPPTTRPLLKFLNQQLATQQLATMQLDHPPIDNAKLQALFNTGLVARHVNRIAGLPKPANCL